LRQVPYGAIKKDTASFVKNEYRPPGMILQDPRNMHLDDILQVLQHCYQHQADASPELAFQFRMFIGAKRKPMFAAYPDTSNISQSKPTQNQNGRKKKGKGKERVDPLEGLLQIDESVEPLAANRIDTENQEMNSSGVGPSNASGRNEAKSPMSAALHQTGLVRIGMGQMLQLKDMEYEALGPVNGLNEGYPKYEVSQVVLDMLTSDRPSMSDRTPNPTPVRVMQTEPDLALPAIDPALLAQGEPSEQQSNDISHNTPMLLDGADVLFECPAQALSGCNMCPSTPPNATAESAPNANEVAKRIPKKQLGKKMQANLSPQTIRQTRTKKKKMTDDDRAAIEAQNMVQSGSRRRSKPTQRR
jgi:hypothetical protein